jgi:hypothetical protein
MTGDTIEKVNDIIYEIVGAVFGNPGQTQDVIPESMRKGGVNSKQPSR